MNERRIRRLQELIKARVAEVVSYELSDPRRGLITITRVEVDRELAHCKVFWSIIGDDKVKSRNEHMLKRAAPFVQREVAAILHTRTTPKIQFAYDESIEGSMRIQGILDNLRREREERGEVEGEGEGKEAEQE